MLTRIGCDVKVVDLGCCYSDIFVDSTGYTTQYAAPEQLAGRKVDVRTDIYAVGKILELLPHPPIYNKVIKRCLNKNPQDRYPSIADLKAALATKKIVRKNMMWVASITVVVFSFLLLSFVFKFSSVPNPAIKIRQFRRRLIQLNISSRIRRNQRIQLQIPLLYRILILQFRLSARMQKVKIGKRRWMPHWIKLIDRQ